MIEADEECENVNEISFFFLRNEEVDEEKRVKLEIATSFSFFF